MEETFEKISQIVEALTDLEIAVESGIENCLSEGVDFNDIKVAITTMVRKYEAEISRSKFRERIREHNKKVKSQKSENV
tara:strand:+ start:1227 stop:1463 length:237 start_codon:yes stop_codon:yes gene_type:complete